LLVEITPERESSACFILGNELAGEGAGEEGWRQFVHLLARLRQPLLQLVGQREQARHSPHDFLLRVESVHQLS